MSLGLGLARRMPAGAKGAPEAPDQWAWDTGRLPSGKAVQTR